MYTCAQDKKGRLYVITAHADTPVNLKSAHTQRPSCTPHMLLTALSARMGLGKGGIRFAPDEALEPVLQVTCWSTFSTAHARTQVAPGSVTPLALVQPTASRVVLMLDARLQGAEALLVHPLRNDRTVALHSTELEAFLRCERAVCAITSNNTCSTGRLARQSTGLT